jgi:P4 family phage/plasmid primase-like protien
VHRLTWRLPYAYDSAATCPKTHAWLREACSGHQDQVQTIRAYLRAVLLGRTELQKFLELVGPGGSGKGTLTRVAQALVGLENVAVTELKYLESNRFETSQLIHKRLIIITDAEQWAGQVSTLKAITGGDSLRVEHKHVRQHLRAVAEGLVIVAANEPPTSADYTSGLARRRLTVPFLHQPQTRRNLLEIKGDHFEGELVDELPGVVNWVLQMSEAEMRRYLLETTTAAPSLAESHAATLVQTNPLAAWADERLVLDKAASVKVGIARPLEHTNRYEWEDVWLYPNYVAYCHNTGNRHLSSRRFTGLLKDLLVSQLRCRDVYQKTINTGSHFFGIRFRTITDEVNKSEKPDTYTPQTPFLITGPPPEMEDPGEGSQAKSEGSREAGEGSGEGFHGVDYGSEGSEGSSRVCEREGGEREPRTEKAAAALCTHIERSGDTSHPSLPALARGNPSPDPSLDPSPDPSPPHSVVPPPGLPPNGQMSVSPYPPCAVCGATARWQDGAVVRCWRCYPPPSHNRKAWYGSHTR